HATSHPCPTRRSSDLAPGQAARCQDVEKRFPTALRGGAHFAPLWNAQPAATILTGDDAHGQTWISRAVRRFPGTSHQADHARPLDRKSTRLNSSHVKI